MRYAPGTLSSSLSTSSRRPVMKLRRWIGRTDSARYEFRFACVARLCVRPQIKLDDHDPPDFMGLEYEIDAVERVWSPASSASGCVRCPSEICAAQFAPGKYQTRAAHESIGPESMFHRFSLGSAP